MTAHEAKAVLLVRAGRTATEAAADTGLEPERVRALVATADANRAARPVPAPFATIQTPVTRPAARPIPTAPRTPMLTPQPSHPARKQIDAADLDSIEELLDWADDAGLSRASTLAARIRTAGDELREMRRRHEHTVAARSKVAELEEQLRQAREELRAASGVKAASGPSPAPAAASREERSRIRAWARKEGYEIGDRGIIAASIIQAYRAAQQHL